MNTTTSSLRTALTDDYASITGEETQAAGPSPIDQGQPQWKAQVRTTVALLFILGLGIAYELALVSFVSNFGQVASQAFELTENASWDYFHRGF